MTINITLSPDLEALLQEKAHRQGQDINVLASEILEAVLAWEAQETEAAIQGIQRGLEDFETANFRSFNEFAAIQEFSLNIKQQKHSES